MSEQKELHHCENCKKEFLLTPEESRKKGVLCPNGCERYHLVFLGTTEEEIQKRRDKFLNQNQIEIEVDDEIIEEDLEQFRREQESNYNNRLDRTSEMGE